MNESVSYDETEVYEAQPLETKMIYYAYCFVWGIFESIYFYFFPLIYLALPLTKVIASGGVFNDSS